MGRPGRHNGGWPGWLGTERGLRIELVEHPEWNATTDEGRQRLEQEYAGTPTCWGRIQSVSIRQGSRGRAKVIGKMCLDCYMFWPADGEFLDAYRRMTGTTRRGSEGAPVAAAEFKPTAEPSDSDASDSDAEIPDLDLS